MKRKRLALTLLFLLIPNIGLPTHISADVPVTKLYNDNLYTWYNANSGGFTGNVNYAGAYVMKPIGDNLYIGLNASVPASDSRGVILAKYDGTNLTKISNPGEDAISRLKVVNDKLVFPGYDPNGTDDWDAGNYYIYDPGTEILTKKRYRYNTYQFVDATTTDANGNYSFTGLKNTSYLVKVIKPANTIFSPAKIGGLGTYDADSDVNATTGEYLTCTGSKYQGLFLLSANSDNTVDAGLRTSAGAAAGTPTAGTRNESFFTGNYSIGNRVWTDTDNDGRQDGPEVGRAGVRVELYSKDPYFPCVVHMNATYGEGNDLYAIGGRPAPEFLDGYGYIAGNGHAIFKSTDGGNEWSPIYEEYGSGYFPYDMTKIGSTYFKNVRMTRYNDAEPWDAYLKVWLQSSTDLETWNYYEDPRKVIEDTLMIDGYVYDVYSNNFTFYNELVEFKGNLVLPNVLGNKMYRFTDPLAPDVIDVSGANFSEILDTYNDADKTFTEMSNADAGMSNRYNTFANVNNNYLYGIGGDKKIYVSTNLGQWLEVADFSLVDSGAEPISIAYWPNTNRIIVATAGQNGGIYYINHTDVLTNVIRRINNSTALDFVYEVEDVDMKTIGTTLSNVDIAIKDSTLFLSRINTNFATSTLDWSGVAGESDLDLGKSVINNLTTSPGAAATHTLYVPIPVGNDGLQVLVCPDATTIAEVTYGCAGNVLMSNGDTELVGSSNVTATKVTLEGQEYWSLEGVSGTGGFAYVTPPPDPDPVSYPVSYPDPDPDPVSYPVSYPDPDPEENNNGNQNGNNQTGNNSNPILYSPTLPFGSAQNSSSVVPVLNQEVVSFPLTTTGRNNNQQPVSGSATDASQTTEPTSNANLLWVIFIAAGVTLVILVFRRKKDSSFS